VRSLRPKLRPALLAIGVLGTTVLLGALGTAQQVTPPAAKPQTAAQRFKNIKVLKKLPADELIPVMRKIDASLGVRCDFCHVVNADRTGFEKDDKAMKGVARQMMVMVQHINKREKVVGGKATCYMCHHGHAAPETQAPVMAPPGGAR
jgi:hypothetical protein